MSKDVDEARQGLQSPRNSREERFRGRTAVVTGGSDGIGLEIARGLARGGARVLLPVRNRDKGSRAAASILGDVPDAHVELLDLDLARLASVAALAATLTEREEPINLLMLNAGIVQLGDLKRRETVDGFELTFQTNFLGHFALATALLPLLRRGSARVAVQGSLAAAGARLPWGDLQGEQSYGPFRAYRASKLALGLFATELARRSVIEGSGISVHTSHPGVSPGSAIAPRVRAALPKPVLRRIISGMRNPPRQAARSALAALAADPSREPRMFAPAGPFQLAGPPRERDPFASCTRPGDARRLWDLAIRWTSEAKPDSGN